MGGEVTVTEAKETLISAMDYMAYREVGTSLYDSDKNRLFGSEHYNSGRPVYSQSPWEGEEFEQKMAELLGWAMHIPASRAKYEIAIRTVLGTDVVLNKIICLMNRDREKEECERREWVFDGTRGEFWTVLLLATVFFALFVHSVLRYSSGHIPRVNVTFVDWLVLVVGIWYAVELYGIDKWLSIAMVLTVLQICVRILIRYGRFGGPSALSTLELLNWASGALIVAGLVSYLAKRLRYQPVGAEQQSTELE